MKICPRCNERERPSNRAYCKECKAEVEKNRYDSTRRLTPDAERATKLRNMYGLSVVAFDELLADQGGGCAICETTEPGGKNWHVDHDHETGKVRGILCVRCNAGIGMLDDSPERLEVALDYLTRPLPDVVDLRKQPKSCVNGHEYTPENTYVEPNGGRRCRTCLREKRARRKAKQAVPTPNPQPNHPQDPHNLGDLGRRAVD